MSLGHDWRKLSLKGFYKLKWPWGLLHQQIGSEMAVALIMSGQLTLEVPSVQGRVPRK